MELAKKTVLRDKTEPVEPESGAIIRRKRQNQKFLGVKLLEAAQSLD
jgi:hypothetical protein